MNSYFALEPDAQTLQTLQQLQLQLADVGAKQGVHATAVERLHIALPSSEVSADDLIRRESEVAARVIQLTYGDNPSRPGWIGIQISLEDNEFGLCKLFRISPPAKRLASSIREWSEQKTPYYWQSGALSRYDLTPNDGYVRTETYPISSRSESTKA